MAAFLVDQGWTVLDRNWSGAGGELDLVVTRAGILRFVEVKQRGEGSLTGLDSVTPSKQRKLRRAAEAYLARMDEPPEEVAFMVVLVGEGDNPPMEFVDDAF